MQKLDCVSIIYLNCSYLIFSNKLSFFLVFWCCVSLITRSYFTCFFFSIVPLVVLIKERVSLSLEDKWKVPLSMTQPGKLESSQYHNKPVIMVMLPGMEGLEEQGVGRGMPTAPHPSRQRK